MTDTDRPWAVFSSPRPYRQLDTSTSFDLPTAAAAGDCDAITRALSARPGLHVDVALQAAALAGHRSAVELLLRHG